MWKRADGDDLPEYEREGAMSPLFSLKLRKSGAKM